MKDQYAFVDFLLLKVHQNPLKNMAVKTERVKFP